MPKPQSVSSADAKAGKDGGSDQITAPSARNPLRPRPNQCDLSSPPRSHFHSLLPLRRVQAVRTLLTCTLRCSVEHAKCTRISTKKQKLKTRQCRGYAVVSEKSWVKPVSKKAIDVTSTSQRMRATYQMTENKARAAPTNPATVTAPALSTQKTS